MSTHTYIYIIYTMYISIMYILHYFEQSTTLVQAMRKGSVAVCSSQQEWPFFSPYIIIIVTVCLDFYDFFIGHHLKLQTGKFTTTLQLQRSHHRVCEIIYNILCYHHLRTHFIGGTSLCGGGNNDMSLSVIFFPCYHYQYSILQYVNYVKKETIKIKTHFFFFQYRISLLSFISIYSLTVGIFKLLLLLHVSVNIYIKIIYIYFGFTKKKKIN